MKSRLVGSRVTRASRFTTGDTARIDVLQLVADGMANKEAVDHPSFGKASVKSHVANTFSKLDARDRAHAVAIGLSPGSIEQ